MHLPVSAERPGVLGQRGDVIGARVGERLRPIRFALPSVSAIEPGGDVNGLTIPARLSEDADDAGDVAAADDEIREILAGDGLLQALVRQLQPLALERRRAALATGPRRPDACAVRSR